ncbi:MAG: hypothetical protein CVT88_04850 [Candidatus Altiarchaeales archaeon HGW-Altiarchaeales-1]|nr:MAG: hypothetical protein CVT89_05065 [Candidatus Altiarchaeales archaeon HGW-Altiarchaeales-2]PKP59690.1 MAG: hypothetical protein CVT88_04850 [Candidatus Altiarchaeales archaeon HGW-Altiarchaeales-1]
MTIRKNQKTIDEIKEKVLNNIRSFGFIVKRNENLGKTIYSIDNDRIFVDIIYASLNNREEYFFGIEQEQFEKMYEKTRNFFQIFVCENEKQAFIIPLSFMIEILKDVKATDHTSFRQWKPIIKVKNGLYVLRLFGHYNITDYLNRYDYLATDEKELGLLKTLDIRYTPEIRIQRAEEEYKNIAEENDLNKESIHSTTIDMLKNIGKWNGFNVLTESKPLRMDNSPYNIDCLWYKGDDLYLAIEVCDKGNVEKDKDALKLAKSFGARKVIIVSNINKLERIRKIFMFNGEIKFWTEVWSFERVFKMYKLGKEFFENFEKFKTYNWNENLMEYL